MRRRAFLRGSAALPAAAVAGCATTGDGDGDGGDELSELEPAADPSENRVTAHSGHLLASVTDDNEVTVPYVTGATSFGVSGGA